MSRVLYIFYPIFSAFYNQYINITANLCTKQGNVSLKSAVYNQERFQIMTGYNGVYTVTAFIGKDIWLSLTYNNKMNLVKI